MPDFSSDPSSTSILCVCKQRRLWRDCMYAQTHLSLRCLPSDKYHNLMSWLKSAWQQVYKQTVDLAMCNLIRHFYYMGRAKRIWYLSPVQAVKVQASLRIRAVSPEPLLLTHTSSESTGTFRRKARSLAPLNGWACAIKICHDRMLEDTNSLDAPHMVCMVQEKTSKMQQFEVKLRITLNHKKSIACRL